MTKIPDKITNAEWLPIHSEFCATYMRNDPNMVGVTSVPWRIRDRAIVVQCEDPSKYDGPWEFQGHKVMLTKGSKGVLL